MRVAKPARGTNPRYIEGGRDGTGRDGMERNGTDGTGRDGTGRTKGRRERVRVRDGDEEIEKESE